MEKTGVLVVDDDRVIVSTLSEGLSQNGYQVYAAHSGEEALSLVAKNREAIDIAIVDVRMPGMSGIRLTQELAEQFQIHSLVLSAYADAELVAQAALKGALGYLVKPLEVSQMIPSVEAGLARIRDMRSLAQNQEQLQSALDKSRKLSVCIGILMERNKLTEEETFNLLRQQARSRRISVEELAGEYLSAFEEHIQTGT